MEQENKYDKVNLRFKRAPSAKVPVERSKEASTEFSKGTLSKVEASGLVRVAGTPTARQKPPPKKEATPLAVFSKEGFDAIRGNENRQLKNTSRFKRNNIFFLKKSRLANI